MFNSVNFVYAQVWHQKDKIILPSFVGKHKLLSIIVKIQWENLATNWIDKFLLVIVHYHPEYQKSYLPMWYIRSQYKQNQQTVFDDLYEVQCYTKFCQNFKDSQFYSFHTSYLTVTGKTLMVKKLFCMHVFSYIK